MCVAPRKRRRGQSARLWHKPDCYTARVRGQNADTRYNLVGEVAGYDGRECGGSGAQRPPDAPHSRLSRSSSSFYRCWADLERRARHPESSMILSGTCASPRITREVQSRLYRKNQGTWLALKLLISCSELSRIGRGGEHREHLHERYPYRHIGLALCAMAR